MIHASIAGGETEQAGELLRILLYHPDVEIISVHNPNLAGKAIDEVHRGMIGDTDLRFSSTIDFDKTNMLFVCAPLSEDIYSEVGKDTRIVDLTDTHIDNDDDFVYGICELNRKPMVRGALHAAVPTPIAQPILLALLPLAKNLLLNTDITVRVSHDFTAEAMHEVNEVVKSLQLSFNQKILVEKCGREVPRRAMFAEVSFDSTVDLAQIAEMFNEFYDDHNFTFVIGREPEAADVANTNKCIIYLRRDNGRLIIATAIDPLVKGAAGTAVHCMNLLFGLHERVGLTLKSSL
jgi:N-acetyl-gamma-glutamyl-phosphate reductase